MRLINIKSYMRNLKNILKEGILDDVDKTLEKSAYEELYPIPSIKDFKKCISSLDNVSQCVTWICTDIIHEYFDLYKSINFIYNKHDFNGLNGYVTVDNEILISINPKEKWRTEIYLHGLKFYNIKTKKDAKNAIIDLFTYIAKHPEFMKELIENTNKCNKGHYSALNISKIINM